VNSTSRLHADAGGKSSDVQGHAGLSDRLGRLESSAGWCRLPQARPPLYLTSGSALLTHGYVNETSVPLIQFSVSKKY
jgi:hypothetical protein